MQKLIIDIQPNTTVEVSSDNVKTLIEQAAFWSGLPKECPLCKAVVTLFHRNPQDFDYYGLICAGPTAHETNFGQYKNLEKGFFYNGADSWKPAMIRGAGNGDEDRPTYGNEPRRDAPATQNNPVATTLGDMITSRQLGMIRAIAREANIDAEVECTQMMRCAIDELSKRAASDLIEHLQNLQRNGSQPAPDRSAPSQGVSVAAAPASAPVAAAGQIVPPISSPGSTGAPGYENHPAYCSCDRCDIPF